MEEPAGRTAAEKTAEPDAEVAAEPDEEKAAKPVKGAKLSCPECGKKSRKPFCFACGKKMTPDKDTADKAASPGDGVVGEHTQPVPAHAEPDGAVVELFEEDAGMTEGDEATAMHDSQAVQPPAAYEAMTGKMEDNASLRIKTVGAPWEEAVLHDLTCAAFSPDVTWKAYPDVTVADVASPEAWQQKALTDAVEAPLEQAGKAQQRWMHAVTLKTASAEEIEDLRWEAHKAFADANPGPATYPTPGELHPAVVPPADPHRRPVREPPRRHRPDPRRVRADLGGGLPAGAADRRRGSTLRARRVQRFPAGARA